MDFRQLRYFEKVAGLKSFSKAAIHLRIAQPALSRQVRLLEEELRVKLFVRAGRGIVPTEAGTKLAAHASFLLRTLEQVREEITAEADLVVGQVALGSLPSLAEILIANLVAKFSDAYPGARLTVRESFSSFVFQWLLEGKIDCAILYPTEHYAGIVEIPLLEEEIYFIGSTKLMKPFSTIKLEDIADKPLIMPSTENGVRQHVDRMLGQKGMKSKIIVEVDALDVIKKLVRDGRGSTLLPYSAFHGSFESNDTFAARVTNPKLTRKLVVAHLADRPMSRACAELCRLIEAEVRQLVKRGQWAGTIPAPAET